MASKSEISALIKSYIKANGNKEITGPILQLVLLKMLELTTDTSGMNYRGSKTVTEINQLASLHNGDFYTCSGGGTITRGNVRVNAGDFVIYNLEEDAFHTTSQFVDLSGLQEEITGAATTITEDNLTPDVVVKSNSDGRIASGMPYTTLSNAVQQVSVNSQSIGELSDSITALSDSVDAATAAAEDAATAAESAQGSATAATAAAHTNSTAIFKMQADIDDIRATVRPNLDDGTAELNVASVQVQDSVILTEGQITKALSMQDGELMFDGEPIAASVLDDEVTEQGSNGVKSSGIYTFVKGIENSLTEDILTRLRFVTVMPTAALGDIVMYLGVTDTEYTKGYIYIGAQAGEDVVWQQLNVQPASSELEWGNITGTLSDQEDLQSALDGKASSSTWSDTYKSSIDSAISASHSQNTDTSLSGIVSVEPSVYRTTMGRYGEEDTTNTKALVIGNGTSTTDRSNAMSVSWDGEVTASEVTANGKKLSESVSNLNGIGGIKKVSDISEVTESNVLYVIFDADEETTETTAEVANE